MKMHILRCESCERFLDINNPDDSPDGWGQITMDHCALKRVGAPECSGLEPVTLGWKMRHYCPEHIEEAVRSFGRWLNPKWEG